jgi:hypothetical protein
LRAFPKELLGLPWGELIVTFLGGSSKPLRGTFHQREFKVTYFEESLNPPQGTVSLSEGELKSTFPRESSKPPRGSLGLPRGEKVSLGRGSGQGKDVSPKR